MDAGCDSKRIFSYCLNHRCDFWCIRGCFSGYLYPLHRSCASVQSIPAAAALAETGLESARNALSVSTLTSRPSCASLASTLSLPTGSSIISNLGAPSTLWTTLSTAISANTQRLQPYRLQTPLGFLLLAGS